MRKVTKSTKSAAHKAAIGRGVAKAAKARKKATPQETAANAVSTALANVSRVVIVQFSGNPQTYAYHTRDESLKEGDLALVISPYGASHGGSWKMPELGGYLTIVKVVSIQETAHSINAASKWIVGKLDLTTAFEEARRREEIAVLEAKIKQARKAAEERVKLEQLRELSPELDTLITQLDQLQGR